MSRGANALVLTGSFQETRTLYQRLQQNHTSSDALFVSTSKAPLNAGAKSKLIAHLPGMKLARCIDQFRQQGGLFITPSGASGMDIRAPDGGQFFHELVITRLPFGAINPDTQSAYIEYSTQQYQQSEMAVRNRLYQTGVGRATRILRQKIGRGIRAASDRINLYILDPRFPRLNEKTRYHFFANAIPPRFKSAYMDCYEIGLGEERSAVNNPDVQIMVEQQFSIEHQTEKQAETPLPRKKQPEISVW